MNFNTFSSYARRCVAALVVCPIVNPALAKEEPKPFRYYYVEADVVSLDAKQSLASYEWLGHVDGAPGATIGSCTPDTDINIAILVESDRLYADVVLTSKATGDGKTEKKHRVDLTNLQPTSIDVGSKDGRTYHLNLVPTVRTVQVKAKPFREVANDLYRLRFHSSRLMLNDNQYIGRMLASDAELLWVDICGVAHIEFSLRKLKGAEPWGRLQDGQITIANPDGTTIEITNVTNGSEDRVVEGGPFTVWVRWTKPLQTVEEFRTAMKAQREEIKASAGAAAAGDTVARALEILDSELAREPGPWVISCGASGSQAEFVRED